MNAQLWIEITQASVGEKDIIFTYIRPELIVSPEGESIRTYGIKVDTHACKSLICAAPTYKPGTVTY